jgi:alpha,alpha-trehalase
MNDAMQGSWSNDDVRRMRAFPLRLSTLACVVFAVSEALGQTSPVRAAPDSNLPEILAYIHNGWDSLTRSTSSCSGISDPKLSGAPLLYLPAGFSEPSEVEKMQHECGVKVAYLPQVIDKAGTAESDLIEPPGLLYLQNKYVVPGGRFNEMYGWDSYFIIRGLLRDGRVELARGMVENFFFEIEHYGAVLNANRTYYLTRSQPPFLSSMVVAVHEAQKAKGQNDQAWLEKAYGYVKRDHDMWTRDPHLAGSTGLSRYYDFGDGPAMEALQDENDIYRQVAAYFVVHPAVPPLDAEESDVPPGRASGLAYSVRVCSAGASQSSCEPARLIKLKPDYYKGDRSMRESGFDISFRFGPYGAATHHYAPVCLNSLLFKTERDLEGMSRLLGKHSDAEQWQKLAEARKLSVQEYLWDEQQGFFFDYDFGTERRSSYIYATTFYPLWAGLATDEQARAVMKNLHLFEHAGGLAMSLHESQGQWDYPFGWAPIQLLAVEGMRRYGYNTEADRVSAEFLSTVLQNFVRDRTIREKYNVVTRSSETQVRAGYSANVVGFGWTNATFLELLNSIPPEKVGHVPQGISVAGAQQ